MSKLIAVASSIDTLLEDSCQHRPAMITCKYSCHLCGLKKIEINVKAREAEDLMEWMAILGAVLSADHNTRSPHCHPEKLADVMIPIAGANKVGGPMLS